MGWRLWLRPDELCSRPDLALRRLRKRRLPGSEVTEWCRWARELLCSSAMSITHGLDGNGGVPSEVAAGLGNPCLFDLASLGDTPPPHAMRRDRGGGDLFRTELVALLEDLRRFARRLTGSSPAADDLVQETCRRALEARHQFNAESELRAWLFRILRNIHIDLLRRASHEVVSGVNGDELMAEPVRERPVWDHLSDDDITSALEALSPAFVKTYRMYAVDRLSYADIARELNVPVGTVGTRLRRARLRLRQVMLGRMAACPASPP